MYGPLEEHIRGMLDEQVSEEQVDACLRGWELYFRKMRIHGADQDQEFHAIVRARFSLEKFRSEHQTWMC